MKHLSLLITLFLLSCETGQVINNAKPIPGSEKLNNIAIAADTATRTWIPWYILLVTILIIMTVKVWKNKT